jgi:hypothetical protein
MTEQTEERCRNGHLRTPENTMYENLRNGKKRRRCRVCRNLRNRRSGGDSDAIIIGSTELVDNTVYDMSSLTIDQRLAVVEFDKAKKKVDTKCRTRPRDFVDWEASKDYVSEVPTPEYAASLCAGCPLFNLCGASAEAQKPAWGVWGGKVYIFGNEYTEGEYDNRNNE